MASERIFFLAAATVAVAIGASSGCNLVLGIHDLAGSGGGPDAGEPCENDGQCDDGNPCTADTCQAGACTHAMEPDGPAPSAAQTPGDCKSVSCADGVGTEAADDSDVPKTDTDCDEELCAQGTPSNPPLPDTTACGPQKTRLCDGSGACVECNSPAQCPGTDEDCQARSCVNHVCGTAYSPSGTPRATSFQKDGDCQIVVCDGAGSSAQENDDTDPPVDGNPCTKDLCINGNPSHPFEPVNTACGVNSACDATGQCGCANDLACTAPNTCGGGNPGTSMVCGCTPKSCAALGKTCGTVADGCFATQSCNNGVKDATETDVDCGGNGSSCGDKCASGKQCIVDSDCVTGHCSDGVCCNTACTGTCMACSSAKKGGGANGVCGAIASGMPDTAPVCTGANACDGAGNCKKVVGQTCSTNAECLSGNCPSGTCQ